MSRKILMVFNKYYFFSFGGEAWPGHLCEIPVPPWAHLHLFLLSVSQAAADYVKAHLPETLKQQLQTYEREKKDSSLSHPSILEQRILAVDRDMVEKFSASHDEAGEQGMSVCFRETVNHAELLPFVFRHNMFGRLVVRPWTDCGECWRLARRSLRQGRQRCGLVTWSQALPAEGAQEDQESRWVCPLQGETLQAEVLIWL